MSQWEDAPTTGADWEDAEGWEAASPAKKSDFFSRETLTMPVAAIGNTVDRGLSGFAGALADTFEGSDAADEIFRNMEHRIKRRDAWSNPDKKEQGFAAKAAGVVGTLPAQMGAMVFSPAETGQLMLENGETLDKAQMGALADTTGNVAGMMIPGVGKTLAGRVVGGGVSNAAQDFASKKAISTLADQEATKKQFAPTWESAALAAIPGAGLAVVPHGRVYSPKNLEDKLTNLKTIVQEEKAKQAALEQTSDKTLYVDKEGNVADTPTSRVTESPEMVEFARQNAARLQREAQTGSEPIYVDREGTASKDLGVEIRTPAEDIPAIREQQKKGLSEAVDTEWKNKNEPTGEQMNLFPEGEQRSLDFTKEPVKENIPKQPESKKNPGEIKKDWYTGAPERNLSFTRTLEEQSLRKNAESQKVGPGHYITMDEGMASTYAGDKGHLYRLSEAPFTNALDFGKKYDGVFGETFYKNLVKKEGSKTKANTALKEMGFDAITFKDSFGAQIANIFSNKSLEHVKQVQRDRAFKQLSLVPKSQRGGINIGEIVAGFQELKNKLTTRPVQGDATSKLLREKATGIQPDPEAKSVVEKALQAPRTSANRYLSAGATLEALKRQSPLIRAVGDIVQNWGKRNEKWVRETVFPVEKEFKKLSADDLVELNAVMKEELSSEYRFTPEQLIDAGFSEKQVNAHQAIRTLFDETLKIQNEARVALGKEPITGMEAYHASRWDGDFGVNIKNAKGEVVWKIRAGTRFAADLQAKAILKKMPELVMGDKFDRLNARGADTTDVQAAYSTMLDILGRDNEIVQSIKQLVEAEQGIEAERALGQSKHFQKKTGMRGAVGDRPWMSPKEDAKQFFQHQIQYAKNASKWSEIQKAMPNLKTILSDERLVAAQPEQVKWAQEYVQNALGFGENKVIREIENYLGKKTGISPKAVADAIGGMKFVWVTQKLMSSVGYNAAQVLQLVNTLPLHTDLSAKGYKGNPISTTVMGLLGGMQLGSVHTIDSAIGKEVSGKYALMPEHMRQAMEYAENNSVTNRSVYDETPIGQGNAVSRAISKTVSLADTFTRAMAYMSFVQHLHDSGKFSKETWGDMFKLAEDYTNVSMGDARPTEKAQVFSKAGNIGSAFNTLQTFNVNWFNQWSYFAREFGRGNPAPLFVGLVTQGLLAGAAGLPLVSDLDKMWEYAKSTLPTKMWNTVKDLSVKGVLLDLFGEKVTYGALSTTTGAGFSSRLNAPSIIDAPQIPGGMLIDLTRQLTSVAQATASVDDPVKWSQAALDVSPPGLKEFVAQNLLEKYTQAQRADGTTIPFARKDIATREGTSVRGEKERQLANMGLRPQKEVVEGDLLWNMKKQEAEAKQRQGKLVEEIYSDVRNGKDVADKVRLYAEIGGDVDGLNAKLEKQVVDEYTSRVERKAIDPKASIKTMLMLKKLQELERERAN